MGIKEFKEIQRIKRRGEMTPLLQEYFHQLEEYRKTYQNSELLLLMQVGSFYEAYEIDEPISKGCAKCISNVLRMHLTKKNGKQPPSDSNPWMVGFPTYVLSKHLNRLNEEGYTVVVFDQHAEVDKMPTRILKGVYSYILRMELEEDEEILNETSMDRILYGLHIEKYKTHSVSCHSRYLMSLVSINFKTGAICFVERDTHDFLRDSVQFLMGFAIQEILVEWTGSVWTNSEIDMWKEKLPSILGCPFTAFLTNPHSSSPHYQSQFLRHVFHLSPEDDLLYELNLQYHPTILSVLFNSLSYVEKYDPIFITQLQRPKLIFQQQSFFYNRDALMELNIFHLCERRRSFVHKKKQKTLCDILSQSMSIIGKRYLQDILQHPFAFQKDLLEERQLILSQFIQFIKDEKDVQFPSFPDLEWYYLRWKRGKLSIRQVSNLLQFMQTLVHCMKPISSWKRIYDPMEKTLDHIYEIWDISQMTSYDSISFLRKQSEEFIQYQEEMESLEEKIQQIASSYDSWFRFQRNGMDTFFQCTVRKWETFQYEHLKHPFYEISRTKSIVKLSLTDLDRWVKQSNDLFQQRQSFVEECFRKQSKEIIESYDEIIQPFLHHCAQWDCFYHLAKFFIQHSYCMPVHIVPINESHQIHVKQLRHAIYECIEPDELFVPYSFEMDSSPESSLPTGKLIYGMNSSGKSTFLKSVGIAIWLSQCGLMVPASSFQHTLTDNLLTKIGVNDNLYLKHSTFVAEMSELHCILQRVTTHSFLLCDELTSGTETKSATGIVASCLSHFLTQSIPFLFTTHLHSVYSIPEISQHPKLNVCHFEITCPESTKTSHSLLIENIQLRYNRELKDGIGETTYGIEIARTLQLPASIIADAFRFRNRMEVYVHPIPKENGVKRSKYNPKLNCSECFICKSQFRLHTHHITPQKEWNQDPPPPHAKDGLYNLIVLCETCHQSLHH